MSPFTLPILQRFLLQSSLALTEKIVWLSFFHLDLTTQLKHLLACFSWYVSGWRPCSRTCGKGVQTRKILCRQQVSRGQYSTLPDSNCAATKPEGPETQDCNKIDCPAEKFPGEWSSVRRPLKIFKKGREKILREKRKSDILMANILGTSWYVSRWCSHVYRGGSLLSRALLNRKSATFNKIQNICWHDILVSTLKKS